MKKLFILTAAALAFVACSNDSDKATTVQNSGSVIRLTTGMNATRATNQDIQSTQMANGQSAWVIFTSSVVPTEGTGTGAGKWATSSPYVASAAYTADGAGTLSTASTTTTKWPVALATPATTETVSIKAFAPFSAEPTGTQSVKSNQTAEADYLASDYLYGTKDGITQGDITAPVLVTFTHKLAKVIVNLSSSDAAVNVAGATVTIGNTTSANIITDYTINNTTGNITAGTTSGTVVMADAVGTDGKCAAIIVPQTVAAGQVLFTVNIGTDTYKYTLPAGGAGKTFDSSNVYTYNVTIRTDGTIIILNETINQWTDGTTEGVIAG